MSINTDLIKRYIDEKKSDIIEWLKKLVSFPSENRPPVGFEAKAQDFIVSELENLGLNIETFRPDEIEEAKRSRYWLSGRDYSGDRKNVVAVWKGSGSGKSVLLSGHIDVAPEEPKKWKITPPYSPVVMDSKMYGRGTADMKGGLTAMFWALRTLKELGYSPRGDVIFESLVDEEYAGGNGTLASRVKGFNADFAILGEPSRMEVCPASMGAFLGRITVEGRAGMPYMGEGIPNPVNAMARIVGLLENWEKQWRVENRHPLFEDKGKELNVLIWDCFSGKRDEYVQMGTPISAELSWIVFCYPGADEESFFKRFNTYLGGEIKKDTYLSSFNVELSKSYHFVRPWETDPNSEGIAVLREAYYEYTGDTPKTGGAPFSCDMALYGDPGGMPVVILGPRGGNLHAPDEWVLLDDILDLAGVYALFIAKWTEYAGD